MNLQALAPLSSLFRAASAGLSDPKHVEAAKVLIAGLDLAASQPADESGQQFAAAVVGGLLPHLAHFAEVVFPQYAGAIGTAEGIAASLFPLVLQAAGVKQPVAVVDDTKGDAVPVP